MSIKKKVSIKNAIQYAADMMNMDDFRNRPLMTVFAVEADQKIGSYYSYKKSIAVLDIHNCRAELPCGSVAILGMIMGDQGCDCGLYFNNIYSNYGLNPISVSGSGFIVMDVLTGSCVQAQVKYEVQGNCIVFASNFDGLKVTIQYLGYEIDKEGFPLVNENHIDAIAQYIEYKFALRSRYKPREFRMDEQQINSLKVEWGRKLRDARAEDGAPDTSDQIELTNMINDPISGVGMAMWQYNRPGWWGF